jgi:hypothetical protein
LGVVSMYVLRTPTTALALTPEMKCSASTMWEPSAHNAPPPESASHHQLYCAGLGQGQGGACGECYCAGQGGEGRGGEGRGVVNVLYDFAGIGFYLAADQ